MPNISNKLDLDQLLDLKRAEKPAEDFWDGFQKDFRQRQLQTLIKKESSWSRFAPAFFARSSVLVPLSSAAVALFVLIINFQENAPRQSEYYDAILVAEETGPQLSSYSDNSEEKSAVPIIAESITDQSVTPASASFVMDLIPNDEPESLSYTREFPTSTIPADNGFVAALVSYTIAHDSPTFGMAMRQQAVGF